MGKIRAYINPDIDTLPVRQKVMEYTGLRLMFSSETAWMPISGLRSVPMTPFSDPFSLSTTSRVRWSTCSKNLFTPSMPLGMRQKAGLGWSLR